MAARWIRIGLSASAVLLLAVLGVLAYPQPLFAYHTTHANFAVWSDRPIPPQIASVLDDAARRLSTSDLYDKNLPVRIFFCNASWRLWLYGQHFSSRLGGAADTWLTRNIYIRASDIQANRIHSPGTRPIADAARRPLSYFIAHEVAHILESREFGRAVILRYPQWLTEGYADQIGKGGDFDLQENHRLYQAGSGELDFARSGLYRGFHLRVLLLSNSGMSARQMFANPPGEEKIKALLDAYRAP